MYQCDRRIGDEVGLFPLPGLKFSTLKGVLKMRVGVWFYSLATIATGILNIVWGAFEASHQPINTLVQHVAGHRGFAYISGFWLAAAGAALLWRRTEKLGAAGSAMIYLIFALFWLPRFYTATHAFGLRIGVLIFFLGGVAAQVLLIAPAAMVYAARASSDLVWRERAIITGRWLLGVPPITFGLGHLINLPAYSRFVPHWVPFWYFWVGLTGIAFLFAGSAIVSGIRDVLAARLLALMLLVFEATVEIPPVFAQPHSQMAWGGAVYNLTAIGVCWMFAELARSRREGDASISRVSEYDATSRPASIEVATGVAN
jgi:uncharacterized membrane protein